MRKIRYIFLALVTILVIKNGYASELQDKVQSLFGDKSVVINDYDEQLKIVLVDSSKIYFATHDGRYLFAGPIMDTEQRTNIVSIQQDQLRLSYLDSQPQEVFVSYPSSIPSKYEITVVTDIDCPYCRKLHSHMDSFNQLGVSVNYVMLPRSGVGSASHSKTIAALCSDNPAIAITKAMQNEPPTQNNCKQSGINQHLKIARDLQIKSTPAIILPNGKIKLGLVNPAQLLALLVGKE